MTQRQTPSPTRTPTRDQKDSPGGTPKDSSSRIAHTLTACCRCRHRKQRCDTGLPRCTPCERANSHCEYFDQAKGVKIPRHYVVHLQHKVRDLERELESLENEDYEPDAESLVRDGAAVRIQEHDESKFLGPSSGIAITRLVMHLAKRFTQSESINDIVDQTKAEEIKQSFADEELKPDSKIYPHISDVAAPDLPERGLTDVLVRLFNAKVLAMYPFLHEPTVWQYVDELYNGSKEPFQNFAVRMVIAISLQRTSKEYAGLADSFYLAALEYLEDTVKPMNVRTIQCFILIGAYSLLTPTRTAVYYVIGLATRLLQALGLCEEKTITHNASGQPANPLEVDMRRRLFWCVLVMEFGLAHSMGRASSFATSLEHFDVEWFQVVDDEYITKDGVDKNAPRSLKKWIAIHFFKMRLLQLEIRRKLYQKKRTEPKDHSDPWFKYMEEKLVSWRDATPDTDAGSGLDKAWFIGRYNTMVVFMFRPSPQCSTPKLEAARRCFPACKWNIYMHREQIKRGNVDMTWIFTQAMFMTINTILWTLSFEPIRQEHPREEVQEDLNVALGCIKTASERWPGVVSALELYKSLITACMHIYEQSGNVDVAAASPADTTTDGGRSQTTSPIAQASSPFSIPRASAPDILATKNNEQTQLQRPFGRLGPLSFSGPASAAPFSSYTQVPETQPSQYLTAMPTQMQSNNFGQGTQAQQNTPFSSSYAPAPQVPMPSTFTDLVSWNPDFDFSAATPATTAPSMTPYGQQLLTTQSMMGSGGPQLDPLASPANVPWTDYLYPPSYEVDRSSSGLNQQQQHELMQSLQNTGAPMIEHMINATNAIFYPPNKRG